MLCALRGSLSGDPTARMLHAFLFVPRALACGLVGYPAAALPASTRKMGCGCRADGDSARFPGSASPRVSTARQPVLPDWLMDPRNVGDYVQRWHPQP